MPRRLRALPLAPVLMLALAGAGCGSDHATVGEPASDESTAASSDPGLQHIHGLGISGDRLLIATHSGLWTAPAGQAKAQRVGSSRQDIMGFSVLEDNHFIGSGHPEPNDTGSPPNLGLIESRDGGKTWKNISLLGEADFHVLQSSGDRIYGFNGIEGRLMVSTDGGHQWAKRTPPAAMYDLAIDPRDPDDVVASTERGVFSSADAGKNWRPRRDDTAGLLAWPAPGRLYLVDGQGQVHHSGDGGRQWQPMGSVGGQPAAFIAHGSGLYVALADSTVKGSGDGGVTWTIRARP